MRPRDLGAPYAAMARVLPWHRLGRPWHRTTATIAAPVVSALLALALPALAAAADAYRHSAPIEVLAPAPYIRLPLPASVYAHTVQPDLRDLRLVDARGERVPFALLTPRRAEAPVDLGAAALYRLPTRPPGGGAPPLPFELRLDGARLDVRPRVPAAASDAASPGWLVDLGPASPDRPVASALRVEWSGPAEFSAGYTLETSDDLRAWRDAGGGQLLSLGAPGGALVQQQIAVPTGAARYLRLLWTDGDAPPVLTGARRFGVPLAGARPLDAPVTVEFAPVPASAAPAASPDAPPAGALEFDLGGALPLTEIDLRWTGDADRRTRIAPVRVQGRAGDRDRWEELGATVVYRLVQGSDVRRSPPLPFTARVRWLRLVPDARAPRLDPATTRLVVRAALPSLVYASEGEAPWRLLAGAPDAEPGALPAATLVPDLAGERDRFGTARLGPWADVPGVAEAERAARARAEWRPRLLWALLVAGVAGLGFMVWRLAAGRR